MFAVSVPGLALAIVLGLLAVAVIAWLLSPRDLTIDVEGLTEPRRPDRRR